MEKAPPKSLRQTQGHGSRLWSDMVEVHECCDDGDAGVSIAMDGGCGDGGSFRRSDRTREANLSLHKLRCKVREIRPLPRL